MHLTLAGAASMFCSAATVHHSHMQFHSKFATVWMSLWEKIGLFSLRHLVTLWQRERWAFKLSQEVVRGGGDCSSDLSLVHTSHRSQQLSQRPWLLWIIGKLSIFNYQWTKTVVGHSRSANGLNKPLDARGCFRQLHCHRVGKFFASNAAWMNRPLQIKKSKVLSKTFI